MQTLCQRKFSYAMVLLLALLVPPALAAESPVETITSVVTQTDTANGWSINYPKQRKVFWMAGLLWVFYSDGKDAVYRTSPDALHWSDPTSFGIGGHFGHRIGCWFDGTYFHYALCTANLGEDVRYRRGEPQADGTIKWSAPEQIVYDTPADKNVMYPKIIVDDQGYPWITFMALAYQVPNAPPYDALVLKSSAKDGTWQTEPGFPFPLVAQKAVTGYPDPVGVPLRKGKTFWIYNPQVGGADVYAGRLWDGSAWQAEEIMVDAASPYAFFNAVAEGDDVHLVYGAGEIRYQKRSWEAGWGSSMALTGSASGHTSITLTGPDSVVVSWLDTANHHVGYRERKDGLWGDPVDWIDASSDGLAGQGINVNSLVQAAGPYRSVVVYTVGASAPFTLKAGALIR